MNLVEMDALNTEIILASFEGRRMFVKGGGIKMIKYYCDRCNTEIDPNAEESWKRCHFAMCGANNINLSTLCKNCYTQYEKLEKSFQEANAAFMNGLNITYFFAEVQKEG